MTTRYCFTRDQLARILASLDTQGRPANADVMADSIIQAWAKERVEDRLSVRASEPEMPPHQHATDLDADTCPICFP